MSFCTLGASFVGPRSRRPPSKARLSGVGPVPAILYACFRISRDACFRLQLHSSYARPAPKPTPTHAGHALRLKRRTEKTTPKPRPSVDLTARLERQRSHLKILARGSCRRSSDSMATFSFRSASLTGRETGLGGSTGAVDSGMMPDTAGDASVTIASYQQEKCVPRMNQSAAVQASTSVWSCFGISRDLRLNDVSQARHGSCQDSRAVSENS